MIYSKPPLTIAQQIAQLQHRGLLIDDFSEAEHYLTNIGYYRLAGYWWPLQSDKINHIFKPGSQFKQAIAMYLFDRELRLIVLNVIERLEIGFRTRLIYELSHEHGAWWFEEPTLFTSLSGFFTNLEKLKEEVSRNKEVFIRDHKKRYHSDTRLPPAWKTLEVASFGLLSRLYGYLNHKIATSKDKIAFDLGVANHTFLPSWLQSVAEIRNTCAHHARLWNRHLPTAPKLLPHPTLPWIKMIPPRAAHNTVYVAFCCMKYLLHTISPGNRFTERLVNLMRNYPTVDPAAMGFPKGWEAEPLWVN